MDVSKIVLDTNVLVAALRSTQGASHKLLQAIDSGKFKALVSTPLVLEYASVLLRFRRETGLTKTEIGDIIDYICACSIPTKIHYLWRPVLKDPDDDMLLELAVAGGAQHIVTFNVRDFHDSSRFGVQIITPQQALKRFGVKQ